MIADTLSSPPSRREERRHERREAILDVAEQSFLDNGYDRTTMSGIAAVLGGSKATLWSYFASKDLLFAAVLDRASLEFRREVSLILKAGDGVEQALTRFCREFLTKLTTPEVSALFRLVVGEAHRFPEVGRIFFESGPGRVRELLAGFLGQAMEAGRLRKSDPALAAQHLTGLCMGGCHLQLLLGMIGKIGSPAIEAEVKQAVGAFMRAYAPD